MSMDSSPPLSFESAIEEFFLRSERGEPPDRTDFLARNQHIADRLRAFFADLDFVDAEILNSSSPNPRTTSKLPDNGGHGSESTTPEEADRNLEGPGTIGNFRILEEIGSGSQGVVFKAVHKNSKRVVALKIIREGALASSTERKRFENEIQVASHLMHPNIVAIFECGRDHGRDFFAMEYVDGVSLDTFMAAETLTIEESVKLFLQICDGVTFAHQRGVIHRDLKPANVLVGHDRRLHVLDFGLAKRLDVGNEAGPTLTQIGSFAGTWHYASPEQVGDHNTPIDVRCDVYSLGVILFEMMTDCYPYPIDGVTRDQIKEHILETPAAKPSSIRRDVPEDLDTIILRTLQKSAEKRYQSAASLRDDLNRFLAGQPIEARRDSHWYILKTTLRYYRLWALGLTAASVILALFSITITLLYYSSQAARATAEARASFARSGERYLIEKLDELSVLSNTVDQLRASHHSSSSILRLEKPTKPFPTGTLEGADELDFHVEDWHVKGFRFSDRVLRFLQGRRLEMLALRDQTEQFRFRFASEFQNEDWFLAEVPQDLGAARIACLTLSAQALSLFQSEDDDEALRCLTAARSVALDLADNRHLFYKDQAVAGRRTTYRALRAILQSAAFDASRVRPFVNWAIDDPPIPSMRFAVLSERQKLQQVVEASIVSNDPGDKGHVDLDRLDNASSGLYSTIGFLTPSNRMAAASLSSKDLSDAIQSFALAGETLSGECLIDPTSNSMANRRFPISPAEEFLGPMLPSLRPAIVASRQSESIRASLQLAATIIRDCVTKASGPIGLDDTCVAERAASKIDLPTGLPFGFDVKDGRLILFSHQDDQRDDGRRNRVELEPDADLILFESDRPAF